MIVVKEAGTIKGKPVLSVALNPNVTPTNEMEAEIHKNWAKLYDTYKYFYFIVDIRTLTIVNAFTLVPRVAALLQTTREKSRKQVISTGVIMSPIAQPLFHGVTTLYKPERPVMIGTEWDEVWQKLCDDEGESIDDGL